MPTVTLPNFKPRPYQAAALAYFDKGGKRAITVWHRRAGKDLGAMHHTCVRAHIEVGAYWHFFPTFEQARRSIWEGFTRDGQRILEQVFPGFLDPKRPGSIVARKNDQQMFLELKCGSVWRLMGSDRAESVGAGPKGVVFSEYALCRPSSWDLVRPMLRESGGWAWFITTPRGKNHAHKLYQAATAESGWYRDVRTVRDTGLLYHSNRGDKMLTPDEMMAEERAEGMPEALISQEYLCDWSAALVGSVWGDLLQAIEARGGVGDFAHETDNVFTHWDLGISDSTAIWWWRPRGSGVEVLDFYEAHGKPLSHYLDELEARAALRGYRYAKHFLPHDARARTLVTGSSVLEQAVERLGADMVALTPSLSLLDGIQAARWVLQQPDTRFHARLGEGLEALRQYHYEYDESAKTFGGKPEHDWSSHAADGFRYLAVCARVVPGLLTVAPAEKKPAVRPLHQSFTLDELWESNVSRAGERV